MTDILFGQSYYLRFDPKLLEAMQPFPPLGTLYAAGYLRSRGYDVALFDAMLAESEEEWAQALDRYQPRMAVIYEDHFNYLSKMCLLRMRQAALTMIGMARQRGCTVIVAGADTNDHPDLYLRGGADFVLLGEGEITLGELVDDLSQNRATRREPTILGLAWLEQGRVVRTPPRPDLRALDSLPFPAWDLVDVPRYRRIWLGRHGYYAMNMVTTRGCPYHCNWCAKPIWGQRYNSRSPENVVAELKQLAERYQPDFVWFMDDIFGLKPGWTQRFADLLQKEGLQLPFKCLSRADLLLRKGEVDALNKAGARIVWMGAESGSQKVLDAMEKGIQVEQIYAATQRLHAVGIQAGFFLQFGYPGEERADIERTLQMVRDCRPEDIGISVSYPLPGTKFHAAVRAQLGVQQNWYDSDDLAMLYRGPYDTRFYRQLHRVVHLEFRRDKAWRAFWQGRETPLLPMEGIVGRARALLRWARYAARLPLARWKLNRLQRLPHQGIVPLPTALTPMEAAQPSPQAERG
jgi:anaerobic magnesium-protoporphyrin IX monomethyl ester cyclase